MAETIEIPEGVLVPGDIIRFDYRIQGTNETLVGMAVSDIKKALWSDDRLDYQGSENSYPVDLETGKSTRILSIYVSVRKYRRAQRETTQYAITGVAVLSLVAIVASAVAVYSAAITYQSYAIKRVELARIEEVEKVRTDQTMSDDAKKAALEAIANKRDTPIGLGSGLAAFGGSLVTAAIIIGVLWALSLSGRPGRED